MMKRSWISNLFARPSTRTIRRAPRQVHLALEALEDRWVPSTIVVNNPSDTPVTGLIDLRQAIAMANTHVGDDQITFDKTVFNTPKTISLDSASSGWAAVAGPAGCSGGCGGSQPPSRDDDHRRQYRLRQLQRQPLNYGRVTLSNCKHQRQLGGSGRGCLPGRTNAFGYIGETTGAAGLLTPVSARSAATRPPRQWRRLGHPASVRPGRPISLSATTPPLTVAACLPTALSGTFDGTTILNNCTVSGNTAGAMAATSNTSRKDRRPTPRSAAAAGATAVASPGHASRFSTINLTRRPLRGGIARPAAARQSPIKRSATAASAPCSPHGRGITKFSSLSLNDCTVNANQVNGAAALGGGIYAREHRSVKDSTPSTAARRRAPWRARRRIYSLDSIGSLASNVRQQGISIFFDIFSYVGA